MSAVWEADGGFETGRENGVWWCILDGVRYAGAEAEALIEAVLGFLPGVETHSDSGGSVITAVDRERGVITITGRR